MKQDEIIEMARQVYGECEWHESALLHLHSFAKLVAAKAEAKERDACATIYAQLFTDPENQPTQYGTVTVEFMNREIAKEREDIIQIIKETPFSNWFQADVIEAIRARGEQA